MAYLRQDAQLLLTNIWQICTLLETQPNKEQTIQLGAFSISLAVQDIAVPYA
jgi:hypothetical protein